MARLYYNEEIRGKGIRYCPYKAYPRTEPKKQKGNVGTHKIQEYETYRLEIIQGKTESKIILFEININKDEPWSEEITLSTPNDQLKNGYIISDLKFSKEAIKFKYYNSVQLRCDTKINKNCKKHLTLLFTQNRLELKFKIHLASVLFQGS